MIKCHLNCTGAPVKFKKRETSSHWRKNTPWVPVVLDFDDKFGDKQTLLWCIPLNFLPSYSRQDVFYLGKEHMQCFLARRQSLSFQHACLLPQIHSLYLKKKKKIPDKFLITLSLPDLIGSFGSWCLELKRLWRKGYRFFYLHIAVPQTSPVCFFDLNSKSRIDRDGIYLTNKYRVTEIYTTFLLKDDIRDLKKNPKS